VARAVAAASADAGVSPPPTSEAAVAMVRMAAVALR